MRRSTVSLMAFISGLVLVLVACLPARNSDPNFTPVSADEFCSPGKDFNWDGNIDEQDIEDCKNESTLGAKKWAIGAKDRQANFVRYLSNVVGYSPYLIKSRQSDRKSYCLSSNPNDPNDPHLLKWSSCENSDRNVQFYFARAPVKTKVNGIDYDDYIIQIIPADEFNSWTTGKNKELRCVSKSDDGDNVELKDCSNGQSIWLNLPNGLTGDKVHNPQNFFSNLVLLNSDNLNIDKNVVHPLLSWKSGFANDVVHPLLSWKSGFANGSLDELVEVASEPLEEIGVVQLDLTAKVKGGKTSRDWWSKHEDRKIEKCPLEAFDVVKKKTRVSCLNIVGSEERDSAAEAKEDLLWKDDKWTPISNIHIIFIEQCEGSFSPGGPASCNQPTPIRTVAQERQSGKGDVVQLTKTKNNKKYCLYEGEYELCNRREEKGSHFVLEIAQDNPLAFFDTEKKTHGFNTIIRPYGDDGKCLDLSNNELGDECPQYKLGREQLLRPNPNGGPYLTQDLRYCAAALNIKTGVDYDCQNYVDPALNKMLLAADILAFIPVINLLVSAPLYGHVCNANEGEVSAEGCMGLAIGLPIDMVTLPLDLMTVGSISGAFKAYAVRTSIKKILQTGAKQLRKEAGNGLTAISEEAARLTPKNFDKFKARLAEAISKSGDQELERAAKSVTTALDHTPTKANRELASTLAMRIADLFIAERQVLSPEETIKRIKNVFNQDDIVTYITKYKNVNAVTEQEVEAVKKALEQVLLVNSRLPDHIKYALGATLGMEALSIGVGYSVLFGMKASEEGNKEQGESEESENQEAEESETAGDG